MIQILSGTISSGSVILVEIAIIIVFGLLLGQLAEYLNIPDVTGYLVAGLILGPVANPVSYTHLTLPTNREV